AWRRLPRPVRWRSSLPPVAAWPDAAALVIAGVLQEAGEDPLGELPVEREELEGLTAFDAGRLDQVEVFDVALAGHAEQVDEIACSKASRISFLSLGWKIEESHNGLRVSARSSRTASYQTCI